MSEKAAAPAPGLVRPPVAPPAQLAAGPEWLPQASPPSVAAPLALPPTIDAIELEGDRSFVSGSGPAGALMRLFADEKVVGESPVEAGRWRIETGPLLTAPSQELKIQAIDSDSGQSLGETVITVEIQLPPGAAPFEPAPAPGESPPDETESVAPKSLPPKPEAGLTAQTNSPSTMVVDAPDPSPAPKPEPSPEPEPEPQPEPQAEPSNRSLPALRAVSPRRGSRSVTILGPPGSSPSTSVLAID